MNPRENPRRLRAEVFDQMQYLFSDFNDHQLHALLRFEPDAGADISGTGALGADVPGAGTSDFGTPNTGVLDAGALGRAVRRSAELVPLLASRFAAHPFRPCWEPMDESRRARLFSVETMENGDAEEAALRFLTTCTDEAAGPQAEVKLICAPGGDTLCVLMNHMVCDGAGFKEYLALLASLYTRYAAPAEAASKAGDASRAEPARLRDGGRPQDERLLRGGRGIGQVYRQFRGMAKLRAVFARGGFPGPGGDRKPAGSRPVGSRPAGNRPASGPAHFPLDGASAARRPFIERLRLGAARFARLREYGRARGATVNDVVLAAYARALCALLPREEAANLVVPNMVDLRRYLPGRRTGALCNLSSMFPCPVGDTAGEDFDGTLGRVREMTARSKAELPGLAGLPLLRGLLLLPFCAARRIFLRFYKNPLTGMTNIGVLGEDALRFGDAAPREAWATGSIKHPPYFQLAFTTYRGEVTFTVCEYGTPGDRARIRRFFALLEGELPG